MRIKLLMSTLFVFFVLTIQTLRAQSTIFHGPTTDTVAKGDVYLEFDWLAQNPNTQALDRLHIFSPRAIVGVTRNIEVGANVPVRHQVSPTNTFFEPNVKWQFARSERKGIAASAGAILTTPVNNQMLADTYAVIYGNVSKQMKWGAYGPRFTAGPYGVVGAGPLWNGAKAGAMLGYEQPIHSKINLEADWLSGQNGLGYLTGGLSVKLPAHSVAKAGYSFGNSSYNNDRNNRFVFLRYGITF